MRDFITLALNSKKKTKAALFAELHEYLLDTHTEAPEIMRDIYNYLAPTKKRVSKKMTPFEWVALAADPKEPRPGLRYVQVLDCRASATNGHVVHSTVVDLPDGMYCPRTGQLTSADMNWFPNVERAVSLRKGDVEVKNPLIKYGPLADGGKWATIKVGEGAHVSDKYYNQALAMPEGVQRWVIGDAMQGVQAIGHDSYAFIMPVRV